MSIDLFFVTQQFEHRLHQQMGLKVKASVLKILLYTVCKFLITLLCVSEFVSYHNISLWLLVCLCAYILSFGKTEK